MKILEKEYMFVNPPKGQFLTIEIKSLGDFWQITDFIKCKSLETSDENDYRNSIGVENILIPKIEVDKLGVNKNENYYCILSKHDIKVLINKLQNICNNMEDYIITPEMNARYEEYLKRLFHPEDSQVNYERQQQEVKLIIDS